MSAAPAERITTTKNVWCFLSIPMAFQSGAAQGTNKPIRMCHLTGNGGVMLRDRLVGNPDQTGTVMSSIVLIVTVEYLQLSFI
jgi:hypothetical protein